MNEVRIRREGQDFAGVSRRFIENVYEHSREHAIMPNVIARVVVMSSRNTWSIPVPTCISN